MKVIGKMGKLYVASTLSQLLVRSIRVNLGREKCMGLERGSILSTKPNTRVSSKIKCEAVSVGKLN
jgi:hypothetical protein